MNKEPQGTLEVSKDVVFQLKSMAHKSAGFEAGGSPDDGESVYDTTPPKNPSKSSETSESSESSESGTGTQQDSDEVSA